MFDLFEVFVLVIVTMKYNISFLNRNTRLSLWQMKTRVVLAQMDLDETSLEFDKMLSIWLMEEDLRIERPISQIHLHLSDHNLRDVLKERSVVILWLKLHVKSRSYSYRMIESISLVDHLAVFKEIGANLETLEIK